MFFGARRWMTNLLLPSLPSSIITSRPLLFNSVSQTLAHTFRGHTIQTYPQVHILTVVIPYDFVDISLFVADFGCCLSVYSSNPFLSTFTVMCILHFVLPVSWPQLWASFFPYYISHPLSWLCTWLFFLIKNSHVSNLKCKLAISLQPQTSTLLVH